METNDRDIGDESLSPVLSIVVTCYMHGKYIGECLQSILDQKVDVLYELIVADDHSTDESVAVIESFRQGHPDVVKVVYQKKNVGFAVNFSDALAMTRGEYIANIDGDDVMLQGKLQRQLDVLRSRPDCGLVVHKMRTVDEMSMREVQFNLPKSKPTDFNAEYIIRRGPFFFHSSEMYRAHLRRRNPVDDLNSVADVCHLLQVLVDSKGCYLDEELGLYRVTRTGMTSLVIKNPARHMENTNDMIRTCQVAENLGLRKKVVDSARARIYLGSAVFFLEHGCADKFEHCIEASWKERNTLGVKQLCLYVMRHWPGALRTIQARRKKIMHRQRSSA
jgi:glycosyltransferase involved in cell wall biosynthesis